MRWWCESAILTRGNSAFVGADAAAPLFFRIADALILQHPDETIPAQEAPPGVSKVSVCAESGDLPNKYCPQTVETWYIPGKSPIRVSQLHRAVMVDAITGRPACPPYAPGTTREEIYEFWPSDMMKLFQEAGTPRRKAPVIPNCAADDGGDIPKIAAPLRGVTYTLRHNAAGNTIPGGEHCGERGERILVRRQGADCQSAGDSRSDSVDADYGWVTCDPSY
jgi:penicillin-binding protein 1C